MLKPRLWRSLKFKSGVEEMLERWVLERQRLTADLGVTTAPPERLPVKCTTRRW